MKRTDLLNLNAGEVMDCRWTVKDPPFAGHYFGTVFIGGKHWAVVKWETEEKPMMIEASCVDVRVVEWKPAIPEIGDE